ncbi:MAG TPA: MBL fold metallo-hydrolase [Verrucomicrobiae bacterium]|nr:MBL fold metallo-hydrolase [Verrucomicrobiae bacterium]
MAVKLTILGSGSSGNCAYVETDEARILVDAGFSARQIRQRLATIGRSPENLTGILITHEHADHIAGLLALADKLKIPIYCNRATQEATLWTFKTKWSSSKNPALPGLDGNNHEPRESFQPSLFSPGSSQPLTRTAPVPGRSNANSQARNSSSNAGTASPSPRLDWRLFRTGDSFELNDITVETFSIPHDAQDPVGFVLRANGTSIGFATDLGHVTKLVVDRLRTANVLVLEANHDVKLLQECPHRPWSLKQRILGRHGHLSNEAAADCVEQIMTADLRNLYLGHLSRECNRPEIAHRVVNQRLQKIGAGHVALALASQDVPCPTLAF